MDHDCKLFNVTFVDEDLKQTILVAATGNNVKSKAPIVLNSRLNADRFCWRLDTQFNGRDLRLRPDVQRIRPNRHNPEFVE